MSEDARENVEATGAIEEGFDPHVGEDVRTLVRRGTPVSLREWETPMNSYERERLVPLLDAEAFGDYVELVERNCSYDRHRRPYASYNDAAIGLVIPELVRRLAAATEGRAAVREETRALAIEGLRELDVRLTQATLAVPVDVDLALHAVSAFALPHVADDSPVWPGVFETLDALCALWGILRAEEKGTRGA